MKIKIFITVLIFTCTTATGHAQRQQSPADSVLSNAQEKIYQAFIYSFRKGTIDKLQKIEKRLKSIDNDNWIPKYWLAYTHYYQSVYRLKMGAKEAARKEIDLGINVLKDVIKKDSEVYALLGMMQGYKIQFMRGSSVIELSRKATENAHKAIKLNKKNIRAWYVLGMNAFYTPKAFRSGKKVKNSLTKAVSLQKINKNNPYLPTWGKKQAYNLLIKYYIQKKRFSDAKKVLQKALRNFPNGYRLKRYEETLSKY